jgi:hypothetical protein
MQQLTTIPSDPIPRDTSLNLQTLNHLMKHLGAADPRSLDITQLALALKHQIIPALKEHSKTQDILDQILALLNNPITRPTQTVLEIKSLITENGIDNSEKLQKIAKNLDHALQNPPIVRILFFKIYPRHEDSTMLYKSIYALAAGHEWTPNSLPKPTETPFP